jgi:diacylglycerol kinase (ATP)
VAIVDAARGVGARVHETRTLADLDRAAEVMAQEGATAVVLAGGDGSTMAGVTALRRAFGEVLPPVAIAAAGTVGVIARNLRDGGGERDPVALVRAVGRGEVRETMTTPTLRVHDDAGGDRVAFIFGTGLVARFFEVYDAAPRQGLGMAGWLAGRAFAGSFVGTPFARRMLSPVGATLRVDGVPCSSRSRAREWSLVLASVVRDVGLGIRATYRAGERADRFHVVASTQSPRGLAMQVPRVLTGRAMAGIDAVDALVAELQVTFDTPDGYVLDGDALRAREVRIEAGPVVRVLVGGPHPMPAKTPAD